MPSEGREKITEELGTQLGGAPDDLLDVIVELSPDPASESESMAAEKESFEKAAEPVDEAISRHGGEVIDKAWINRTLLAKIPAAKVAELTSLDEIVALDAPRQIELE
ncbi:MAG TPA: hypothetical protein VI039_04155 [Solirubrobacterales bacterium]